MALWRLGKDALPTRSLRCLMLGIERNVVFVSRTVNTAPDLPRFKRMVEILPPRGEFSKRHIGPRPSEMKEMLKFIGLESLDELTARSVPEDILLDRPLRLDESNSELEMAKRIHQIGSKNLLYRSYIGLGYYNCVVPNVISQNVLQNPGWITQYTPYQPEVAQGRLECLLNFQTMVSELTGMDVANASLLDEATGAAEAMGLCFRMHEDPDDGVFYVDKFCHPQNIAVVKTRAKFLGIKVEEVDLQTCDLSGTKVLGVLLQYPDTEGRVEDISKIIQRTHDAGGLVAVASDLIALVALKPPGDLGADICLGNAQRMGVPLGYGGPHAGFFAVKKNLLKSLPGRLVGQTRDAYDNVIYRLALQPREQHIKKDKANSNICTAQALLANMSALYAVYHGPEGLKMIVKRIHHCAMVLAEALRLQGHLVHPGTIFDTVRVTCNTDVADVFKIQRRAHERRINLRYFEDNSIGVSLDETVSAKDMEDLMYVFCCSDEVKTAVINCDQSLLTKGSYIGTNLERESPFLTHPVFNKYHSEQMLVRYMKKLENKDLSLVHSMIPLGSCTMKLNATTECIPLVMPEFSDIHPFAPIDQAQGYQELLEELERDLCEITGYDKISFQPNSGAQGEYAGLCTIRSYLEAKGEDQRKVALIPMSAHGTNPASAKMAGLNVVYLKTNKNGEVTVDAWKESIDEHKKYLACIMVTYPSTNGIFEDTIREICDSVHEAGGQVYVDGANMNAQVGLCRPGDYGSDVSHLNLHKTFCIPHGGGGPGMGPIGVKAHLAPFLPTHPLVPPRGVSKDKSFGTVSAATWGSPLILPISWAYIKMMGAEGLKAASQVAILNANYMARRLKDHYNILFAGEKGFNAHEFIIDCRPFKDVKVEAVDIAKRLQDYGFHGPTMSWPVINTLMIEPTESEDKGELDRFCDALISIREEIKEIESGMYTIDSNVVKNAPHPQSIITADEWTLPYSRRKAAYPAPWVTPTSKFWPSCGRSDDYYGDKHVVATRHSLDL